MNADLISFVVAAYAVAFVGIGGYAAALAMRLRVARQRLDSTAHYIRFEPGAELVSVDVPTAVEVQHVG